MTKHYFSFALTAILIIGCTGKHANPEAIIETRVDSVLKLMTLEEKIGQMNQYTVNWNNTGPVSARKGDIDDIKNGKVGSMLNCTGIEATMKYQHIAVDSTRLHIPLIFGYDVIHGYKTIFPIPLAGSCSWDLDIIEKAERVAATETAAEGVHWTFAPMVDVSRDARWGRVMEGAGEDPWYGAKVAQARVKGFQGNNLADTNTIVACVKHFAGYGAPDAGREYNTVDMSELKFRNYYMLPYKAAVEAGAGTVMSSFNDIFDTPATANEFLLRKLLKNNWGFNGFVVSDWGSAGEVVNHGYAANRKEAAKLCANAGLDMEMESCTYRDYLTELVKEGKVSEKVIDEAVRRILRIKFKLGLFDNPYKYCNAERAKKVVLCAEHIKAAREAGRKAVVLLKNNNQVLPLHNNIKSIALIGPLADNRHSMLGNWSASGDPKNVVTVYDGLKNRLGDNTKITCVKGCEIKGDNKDGFGEAIAAARNAEVVLLAMGEAQEMSGEMESRVYLNIPGVQRDLMKEIIALGKPTVLLMFNGRPLCINWEKENIPAILECWYLGIQAGNSIADVLFGDYNPSGKLTMTFPQAVGQVPIYYNQKNTGRPCNKGGWGTSYNDITNDPLYPFGYGLSYTSFEYSTISISDTLMKINDTLSVKLVVKNTGRYQGEEVVQLYIRDMAACIVRPIKELKGFEKICLKAGEQKEVSFKISQADLAFWQNNNTFAAEAGRFKIMIGPNSEELKETYFWLE